MSIVNGLDEELAKLDLLKDELSRLLPEATILNPVTSTDPLTAVSELEELVSTNKHPTASVVVFADDGGKVARLLSATYKRPIVTNRIWYFPDGLYWEDVLRADGDAWKVARKVGLFSAAFLSVNQTGHYR
jgi:hypothetical protein